MGEISLEVYRVWNTQRVLDFKWTEDLIQWAGEQQAFWRYPQGGRFNTNTHWGRQLDAQFQQIAAIKSEAETYKTSNNPSAAQEALQRLKNLFSNIANGTLLVSDSVGANVIHEAINVAPDISAIIYCSYRSDATSLLNGASLQTAEVVRLTRFNNPETYVDIAGADRDELARLKSSYESDIDVLRKLTAAQVDASDSAKAAEATAIDGREKLWNSTLDGYKGEWDTLKKTYDNELGLRAPTTYWSDRGKSSSTVAIRFSAAFGVCAGILLSLFFYLGVPHLLSIKPESPFISAIPVVVPVLVGVWVLRVLARLFSENLKIQQDARERETLVKTFLALMKDEKNGRALVTDEDRKIILQALFRQSAVTASDDSPPFGIADLIGRTGKP